MKVKGSYHLGIAKLEIGAAERDSFYATIWLSHAEARMLLEGLHEILTSECSEDKKEFEMEVL